MNDTLSIELDQRRALARAMGGEERVARVHEAGKLSVRERLDYLLDAGSFVEIGALAHSQHTSLKDKTAADGVITGSGRINGRPVFVMADDPSVLAGTRGRIADVKIARIRELALSQRQPLIMLSEAGAARIQEAQGAGAAAMGRSFADHLKLSGRVPLVSVIMGPAFGGPSFLAGMSDFTIQVRDTGFMGMSGPPVVKVGIGRTVSAADIGSATISAEVTGQAHRTADSDEEALAEVRRYLGFFPSHCDEWPPLAPARAAACDDETGQHELRSLVPEDQRRGYDASRLLALIVDQDSYYGYLPDYGRSLITGFARLDGQPVGIVANNPRHLSGALDEKCAIKSRRFIDLCDAFHIPLIFFVDSPGFLVGPDIERHRMVSLCGRLMHSLLTATVPKLTVVTRKAVGMAYLAMCGRVCQPDLLVAWPSAFFDVMGPDVCVNLVHGREIEAAADPQAARRAILQNFAERSSAFAAAGLGLIDDVIKPEETRARLIDVLTRSSRRDQVPGFRHAVVA